MKFRALAFDLDGTLIDSKIDFQSMRKELGLVNGEPVLEVVDTWPSDKRQKGLEIIHRHEVSGAQSSSLIDGAKEFIEHLRSQKIPCAIFTRNSRETAMWSLQQHQIPFDLLLSRDDAKPKPDPDGLWKIAAEFDVTSDQLLFVGDYLYDLQAGLRSGTPTALYLPAAPDFETTGAHYLFNSYPQIRSWFFENHPTRN